MRALVTGGLGFIGSHVTDLLVQEGVDVTVVDNLTTGRREHMNPRASYWLKDVRAVTANELAAFEWVFHLAAWPRIQPSFEDPVGHEEVNVVAALDLATKLRGSRRLRKLVFSSSSSLYGDPTQYPTPESSPPAPLSPYALQKYAAELSLLLLGERFGLPVVALRYFNVYGPRSFNPANSFNAYSSVVGIFAEQARRSRPLSITSDGTQRRDFVHVRDVARANYLAASSAVQLVAFNVGCGEPMSILDLARRFDRPYEFIPERKGEASVTWADTTRISRELGWSPTVSIDEGIHELCAV